MTAYLVAQFNVKNKDALASYSAKAGPVINSFGGQLMFKSPEGEILDGDHPKTGIAVFEFPDQETLKKFHGSADYQSLIEERNQGADMAMIAFQA